VIPPLLSTNFHFPTIDISAFKAFLLPHPDNSDVGVKATMASPNAARLVTVFLLLILT
jgi:hypothetical protein